jgi:transposase
LERVSNEHFVKVWVKSPTLEEVARRLGYSEQTCYNRANKLRKAGVKLPFFKRKSVVDPEALNELIEQLAEEDEEDIEWEQTK